MSSPTRVVIPRAFSWLLPGQGLVAAVAIYSCIYIFGVGTIPFILCIVAGAMHFLLGVYFCMTQSRSGSYHMYTVPVWLAAAGGVWCGALYYFARHIELIALIPENSWEGTDRPLIPVWTKVGCAMAALAVLLDFVLLGIFIISLVKQRGPLPPQPGVYASAPVYAPPPHFMPQPPVQQVQPHYSYGHYQYQAVPTVPATDQKPPAQTQTSPAKQSYNAQNRIDVIRRLCALQHPDGHWDHSPELAELVRFWGGREVMAPAHGVTALTHACLMDLCNYVWTAQREGREQQMLSSPELISLQSINWDLGWAKNALDRAGVWMGMGVAAGGYSR